MRINLLKALNEHFRIKVFAVFTLLIFVISASFTSFFIHRQSRFLTDDLMRKGKLLTGILAYNSRIGVFSENKDLLGIPVGGIFQQEEILEVSVFNLEGRLLINKEKPGIKTSEKSIKRSEGNEHTAFKKIKESIAPFYFEENGQIEFWSPVISSPGYPKEESLFFKDDLRERKDLTIGSVRITVDKGILKKQLNDLLLKGILIGIIFLIMGSGVTYILVRGITKPLNRLTESVRTLGLEGVVDKAPIETEDEIGKLAKAFNDMSDSLKIRETALRESEERYKELADSITDVFFAMDKKLKYIYWNRASEELFGIKAEDAIGKTVHEIFPDMPENRKAEDVYLDVLREQKHRSFINEYQRADKKIIFEINVYPSRTGLSVYARDITERKQAEEKIKASLREKEVLLNEIHHRVRNNLQVISSLLNFHAASTEDETVREILRESQTRIRSMALIHTTLLNSGNLAEIDMGSYVKSLSQELSRSYQTNPGRILLTIETDEVYLSANNANTCGLILNELISNAFKYAFPENAKGEINIILRHKNENEIDMFVRDNGRGLPKEINLLNPATMGLHLVTGLVKNQLLGNIEIGREGGTEYRINFPL